MVCTNYEGMFWYIKFSVSLPTSLSFEGKRNCNSEHDLINPCIAKEFPLGYFFEFFYLVPTSGWKKVLKRDVAQV